jgi:hypothetical protein
MADLTNNDLIGGAYGMVQKLSASLREAEATQDLHATRSVIMSAISDLSGLLAGAGMKIEPSGYYPVRKPLVSVVEEILTAAGGQAGKDEIIARVLAVRPDLGPAERLRPNLTTVMSRNPQFVALRKPVGTWALVDSSDADDEERSP